MKKIIGTLMLITVFSKILGFVRELILSYHYGTTNISDAYLISLTIPTIIFSIIATGIVTGFIPLYTEVQNKKADSVRFTNNTLTLVMLLSLVIITLSIIFAKPLVKLFASGFSQETMNIAINFTRISIIGILFSGICYIFKGYLQSNNKYYAPALIGVPFNIVIVTSIIMSTKHDLIYLPIGIVVAEIFQIIVMIPFMIKCGYKFRFVVDLKDKYLKKIILLSLPVIIGISVDQINKLIDRTLASQISIGGISALNYSNRLNGFVFEIFILTIATVMYPTISKMAAENNITGLKKAVTQAITGMSIFLIPGTLVVLFFSKPIITLLYARGAFDEIAVNMTSNALLYYSIGMIGLGLREVFSRVFYSIQDTRTPMINSVIAIILNIVLNIILSRYMGISGLALATSISTIFCSILLFFSLRKKIGWLDTRRSFYDIGKIILASTVMIFVMKFLFNKLVVGFSSNISFIIAVPIGMITYLILILIFKVDELDMLLKGLMKKIRNVEYGNE